MGHKLTLLLPGFLTNDLSQSQGLKQSYLSLVPDNDVRFVLGHLLLGVIHQNGKNHQLVALK